MSLVGARVLRKEDPRLLTGRGTFVDDLEPTRCTFATFVSSPLAHARITSVDVSAALEVPGVLGVWTGADLAGLPPLPGVPGMSRTALATDKVRFVGEPVAVVVAEDRYAAADGASAVIVDYDPLPAVATVQAATAEGAPALFDAVPGNVISTGPSEVDVTEDLASSELTATFQLRNNRCAPVPIEPTACLAEWTVDGITMHATTQAPHHLRNTVAGWLGVPQTQCRIIAPDVGGGFGAKINWYPELFLAPWLSRAVGRPVKFAQTRAEAMTQMYHGRDQEHVITVGFQRDGTVNALRVEVTQNLGGYPDPNGLGMPVLTTWMLGGCYRIPKIEATYRTVVTNRTPIAAYRGAGRPEAAYTIERVMDVVARRAGLDPAEVRRKNLIPADDFPHATANPAVVYDSGNYPAALDEALRLLDYDALRAEQERRRNDPDAPLLGIGLSSWLEIAGFGPNGSLEAFGHLASWESAQVRVQPDGSVIIFCGSSPHGQGHETTFAQIAADELGVSYDRISVRTGDTSTVVQGIGTMGSRGVATGGSAVKVASGRVAERARKLAAHLLEASEEDIEIGDDEFRVRGVEDKKITWAEVAWASFQPLRLPEDLKAGALEERLFQESPNFSYPSGCYGCVVSVDRRSGQVTIEKMVLVDDCGHVVNPLLAEGQVHGGVAQGIAQALFEQMTYDEEGQPLTGSLLDYLAPAAADLPGYTSGRIVSPSPNNPLGAKGIGESGAVGAPAAVVNAVVDALAPFGVEHLDMPVTSEAVWRAMGGPR